MKVSKAEFNNDAARIIVKMRDGQIGLWDATKGTAIAGDLGAMTSLGSFLVDPESRQILVGFRSGDF